MLKFPKNWLKNFVNTRIPEFFLILIACFLIYACAPQTPKVSPRTDLQDPLQGTNITATPEYKKAYQEFLRGDQQKARQGLFEITRTSPDYFPAYLALAYSYLSENNTEYAESYTRKALEVQPDYALGHFVLSNLLESRQEYADAMTELIEVERIDPQFPNLGQAKNVLKLKATEQYLDTGRKLADTDPEKALRYLKAAHDMAPEVAQIPMDIAQILIKQNNCGEAVKYLAIAAEKSPDDLEVKTQLAECLFVLGEYREVRNIYEQLLLQAPGHPEYQSRLEEVKRKLFLDSLPAEYQSIPNTSEITRAQMAAYLVIQLDILNRFRSDSQQIVVDIINTWAQSYIQKVVSLGIMDVYPNRTFQPNQPTSKLELAKAASRILEIVEVSGQGKFPADPQLVVPDIPPGHLYYGLVAKPLSARVISLDADGRFHSSRRISGAELISAVNHLKALMEPL